jgi:hypothetical protein
MRLSIILTSGQAAMLYDLVKEHEPAITARTSLGIYDGLLYALMQIDRGGGALVRHSYGSSVVDAAIVSPSTYFVWQGARTIPRPYWDLHAMLPELTIKDQVIAPATVYRALDPLALMPFAPTVLPHPRPPLLPLT